jgi:hypothetical protein
MAEPIHESSLVSAVVNSHHLFTPELTSRNTPVERVNF